MKRFNIEQIHDKFYIFDNWTMQFYKDGFNTKTAALNYINSAATMCNFMC
nr:hypothetical protein [Bacillota bacterium]